MRHGLEILGRSGTETVDLDHVMEWDLGSGEFGWRRFGIFAVFV
jgi:hypothetical protein